MRMKSFVLLIASAAALVLSAGESFISTGPIVPGEWNANYKKAREYAEQNNLPFIAIVSRTSGCHFCAAFTSKWSNNYFIEWAKKYGAVMGAFHIAGDPYSKDTTWVNWVRGSNSGYPMVCLYWKKKDGKTVYDRFMGRSNNLGDIDKDGKTGTQADFIARIQRAFAGWSAVPAYVGATKIDSYEPQEVYFSNQDMAVAYIARFSMTREYEAPTNQSFRVSYPDSSVAAVVESFEWKQGEKTKTVASRISRAAYEVGKTAKIELLDGENKVVDTVEINFVEAPYLGGSFPAAALVAPPSINGGEITLTRTATGAFNQELVYSYLASTPGDYGQGITNNLGPCRCGKQADYYENPVTTSQITTNSVTVHKEIVTTVRDENGEVLPNGRKTETIQEELTHPYAELAEYAAYQGSAGEKLVTDPRDRRDVSGMIDEKWTPRAATVETDEEKIEYYHHATIYSSEKGCTLNYEIALMPPPAPGPLTLRANLLAAGDVGSEDDGSEEDPGEQPGENPPIAEPVFSTNVVTNVTMVVIAVTEVETTKEDHVYLTDENIIYKMQFETEVKDKTVKIDWSERETEKKIKLDFADAVLNDTNNISLSLYDGEEIVGENTIDFIDEELPNSVHNPYFVGEKTAAELNWGDWTFDIDAAKAKAAADEGQVLYVALGVLWCGDCKKTAANLFERPEFAAWATENKVILVCMDIPNSKGAATLLSSTPGSDGASGMSYLFSKGKTDADGEAIIERNQKFAADYAGFNWKDVIPRTRLAVPSFVKLGSDGKVAGRFINFGTSVDAGDGSPTAFNEGYLKRLDEVLASPDGEDADSDFATPVAITLGGGTNGVISAVDRYDVVKVEVKAAGDAFFQLKGLPGCTKAAELSLWRQSATMTKADMLQAATGVLDENGISFTFKDITKGTYFVRIKGDSKNGFELTNPELTHTAWELTTSKILVPAETASIDNAIGNSVVMRLMADQLYSIQGLDFTDLDETGLVAQDAEGKGPYFLATKAGDITLPVLYKNGTVTFQIWNPGVISFTEAKMTVFEFGGTGVVTVVRLGGGSGEVAVDVKKIGGDDLVANRYVWQDDTLYWEDGEIGAKTIEFALNDNHNFEKPESFTIALTAEDFLGEIHTDEVVITVSDTTKPCFNSLTYGYDLPLNFAFADSTSVFNIDPDKTFSLVCKSGKLPSGITLKYDRATREVKIAGTPTKAGEYSATYIIRQGKEEGIETTFDFTVFDAAKTDETGEAGTALNEYLGRAANWLVPLFVRDGNDEKLVGELTLSTTSRNKISAKYRGDSASTIAFSGAWQQLNGETGVAMAQIKGAKGSLLTLYLSDDGWVSAQLTGVENLMARNSETISGMAKVRAIEKDAYKPYEGYYTLTIPVVEGSELNSGTGYMTLNLTGASALKNGTAKYSGRYGNGTTFSGTLRLIEPDASGKDYIWAPVFVRSKKDLLSAVIHICPDGASKCDLEDTLQLIKAESGYKAINRHTEEAISYLNEVTVYGGFYKKNRSLDDLWDQYYADLTELDNALFNVFIGDDPAKDSIAQATVNGSKFAFDVAGEKENFTVEKLTLAFTKSTGIVNGKVKLRMKDEIGSPADVIDGTWYGVVMPGWTACGECGIGGGGDVNVTRPFSSGTMFWTVKKGGFKYKASMAINLDAPPAQEVLD